MTIYRRPDGQVFELVDSGNPMGCRLCAFNGQARQCHAAPMDCTRSCSLYWRELVQTPPPAPRLLVDRLWSALQAAGLTAIETRQYIRNLEDAARGEHVLKDLLPRGRAEFVWSGFVWGETPEGFDYWRGMVNRLDPEGGA